MQIAEQRALRDRTAAVMIEWANNRRPPFTGDDVVEFKDAITAAHLVADEGRLDLQRWVDAGRRTGLRWADIGDALGISKQAAQQRFKGDEPDNECMAGKGEKVVRFGATAFNEMVMMRKEGARGNELIQIGPSQLMFQSTSDVWEYRRTIGLTAAVAKLEKNGWTYVASWLPFHYFKRRLPD